MARTGDTLSLARCTLRAVLFGLVLLVTSIVATPTNAQMGSISRDRDALVALYNATDGPDWFHNSNWLSDKPLDSWHGITTDNSGRVTELVLIANNLTGQIPTGLGALSNLDLLRLGVNKKLIGRIPADLEGLSRLVELDLGSNGLSGEIPPELGRLANLEKLELSRNSLSGQVPTELGNLSNLKLLHLDNNKLSGKLPRSLTDLSGLGFLYFELNAGLCAPGDDIFRGWLNGVYRLGPICQPTHMGERVC